MLQNSFFNFTKPVTEGGIVKVTLTLNAAHAIFNGHFPGQPIVPGVCMVQMVKEVIEHYIAKSVRLVKADNIKFLLFIDPNLHPVIRMELKINTEDERIKVDAQLLNNEISFFKFKGTFTQK